MATIPPVNEETVFSGEFETGFESFIGDNIAYRSQITDFSKTLDEKRGFVPKTGKIISTNKDIGTGTTQKQTLLVADNTIMEMFIRNDKTEQEYADAINRYAEKLPENIKLFSMVIPTQLEFKEPIYKNLQDSQKDTIDVFIQSLTAGWALLTHTVCCPNIQMSTHISEPTTTGRNSARITGTVRL